MRIHVWKRVVRKRIDDVRDEWQKRMISDTGLNYFLTIHNVCEPGVFWKISKANPKLSYYCRECIKLVGLMFSYYSILSILRLYNPKH